MKSFAKYTAFVLFALNIVACNKHEDDYETDYELISVLEK